MMLVFNTWIQIHIWNTDPSLTQPDPDPATQMDPDPDPQPCLEGGNEMERDGRGRRSNEEKVSKSPP